MVWFLTYIWNSNRVLLRIRPWIGVHISRQTICVKWDGIHNLETYISKITQLGLKSLTQTHKTFDIFFSTWNICEIKKTWAQQYHESLASWGHKQKQKWHCVGMRNWGIMCWQHVIAFSVMESSKLQYLLISMLQAFPEWRFKPSYVIPIYKILKNLTICSHSWNKTVAAHLCLGNTQPG